MYYPSLIYLENLFTDTRKILDATEFARNDIATPIIPKMGPKIKIKDTSLFETFEGQENLIYFQANQKLTTIRLKDPILFHEIIIK